MSQASLHFAGVVLITVPAIAFGGARLLAMIYRHESGYLDNPVRQNLWRAGHAHAGVLVILTLIGLVLVDQADLSSGWRAFVRYALVAGPILMPLGFFLSVAPPHAGAQPAHLAGPTRRPRGQRRRRDAGGRPARCVTDTDSCVGGKSAGARRWS